MTYTDKELLSIVFAEAEASGTQKALQAVQILNNVEHLRTMLTDKSFALNFADGKEKALVEASKQSSIDKNLQLLEKYNILCVTYYSKNYPESLRQLPDAPLCLYCMGDLSLLKANSLAVVGTRKPNSYGRRVAENFVTALAKDMVIVSGLAYGIDSIAHETTLNQKGKTIAVLGSGLCNIYPPNNLNLAQRILQSGGLIVTEYPLYAIPKPYHFPHRNRIVAGLSKGVLVCQAPLKSGTSVTVDLALQQGKDIFVVPGEIYDFGFLGSNKLIKDLQGAMVTDPSDIAEHYKLQYKPVQQQLPILDDAEQRVADLLADGQKHFNQIVAELNILPKDVMILLANMELKGIICKLAGNFYRLNGGN